jgi:hypothetical protein
MIDDSPRRRQIAEPMRQSVLTHDTHDVLVDKLIAKFTNSGPRQ